MWQGSGLNGVTPEPLQPPSPECQRSPPVKLPTSSFVAEYGESHKRGPMKATFENGRLRLVNTFAQGFSGTGMERYPTGETYVGDYVDARRHGRGTFSDHDSRLLSLFEAGQPRHEGTKLRADPASEKLVVATRTHDGKPDGQISLGDAQKIAKNIGLTVPRTLTSAAGAKVQSRAVAESADERPDFLTRLAEAEGRDTSGAADSLPPRELRSPPSLAAARKQRELAGANASLRPSKSLEGQQSGAAGKRLKKARPAAQLPAFA